MRQNILFLFFSFIFFSKIQKNKRNGKLEYFRIWGDISCNFFLNKSMVKCLKIYIFSTVLWSMVNILFYVFSSSLPSYAIKPCLIDSLLVFCIGFRHSIFAVAVDGSAHSYIPYTIYLSEFSVLCSDYLCLLWNKHSLLKNVPMGCDGGNLESLLVSFWWTPLLIWVCGWILATVFYILIVRLG